MRPSEIIETDERCLNNIIQYDLLVHSFNISHICSLHSFMLLFCFFVLHQVEVVVHLVRPHHYAGYVAKRILMIVVFNLGRRDYARSFDHWRFEASLLRGLILAGLTC